MQRFPDRKPLIEHMPSLNEQTLRSDERKDGDRALADRLTFLKRNLGEGGTGIRTLRLQVVRSSRLRRNAQCDR
jgi:hypothetical protein